MLRERIITALVLLALLIPAVIAESPLPFALLTLVMMAAAGWEWARLCQLPPAACVLAGVALGAVCGGLGPVGLQLVVPAWGWGLVTLLWVVGGGLALRAGPQVLAAWPRGLRLAIGWVLLMAAWFALVALRARGLPMLVSVVIVVWGADIAAYFGGRAFGRRKLAPTVSPGKSWEGVWSGLAFVMVVALVGRVVFPLFHAGPDLYNALAARLGLVGMLAAVSALVALEVMGDLIESLVKRAVGAKDSSGLLPGHGGVLDRVDALLPVLPAALVMLGGV
jgi:phosphatidate cytidylyltransferase